MVSSAILFLSILLYEFLTDVCHIVRVQKLQSTEVDALNLHVLLSELGKLEDGGHLHGLLLGVVSGAHFNFFR